jgi:signal transduction histidine kinase
MPNLFRLLLGLLMGIVTSGNLHGQPPPVPVLVPVPVVNLDSLAQVMQAKNMVNSVGLRSLLGVYRDSLARHSFQQMRREAFLFTPNDFSQLIYHPSAGNLWVKCKIAPYLGNQQWFWQFPEISVDTVDIYEPQPDGTYRMIRTGDVFAFTQNTSRIGGYTKPVRVSATDTLVYFFRLCGGVRRPITFRLTTPYFSMAAEKADAVSKALMLGAIVVMLLYNLFLFVSLRDRTYGWYVGYLFFNCIAFANWMTFSDEYFFPEAAWFNQRGFYVGLALAFFCGIGFSQHFIDTRRFVPFTHRLLQGLQVGCVVFAIAFVVRPFFPNYLFIIQAVITPLATVSSFVVAGYVAYKHRYRPAKYYLLAWSPLLVISLLHALYQQIVGRMLLVPLGKDMDVPVAYFGIAIESLLLSIALAYRFNLIKQDAIRERLQRVQLEQEREQQRTGVIIETQEQERKRIAQDLHDELGTALSTIKLYLSRWKTQPDEDIPVRSEALLDEAIYELRAILLNLTPRTLEEEGYAAAVQELAFRVNQSGYCQVDFYEHDLEGRLSREQATALYRISQELLNNTLKHARARQVTIQAMYRNQHIVFTYEDDGTGFDTSQSSEGYGLQNIQARTEWLKGTFHLESHRGRGTWATIEFPAMRTQT